MPSKFIQAVKAEVCYPAEYKARMGNLSDLRVEQITDRMINQEVDTKYCIGVHWERYAFLHHEELPVMKERIISELNHDIYGEFIRDLLRLRWEIGCHDHRKAKELINKILKEVTD